VALVVEESLGLELVVVREMSFSVMNSAGVVQYLTER
jgi:hypothetical protein